MTATVIAHASNRVPLWLKFAYTAFMIVLVPVYWHYYGPTNFLYFCDVALFLTLAGLWLDSPLLISMCAVGILAPQALWVLDFVLNIFGVSLIGMTDYMFKHENSLFLRGLSLFHGWLPFLLAYLVWQLGYDRRGLPAWTVLAWALILVCFFFMPPPIPNAGLTPVNINYVWGPSDTAAQTWVSPVRLARRHDDRHAAAAVLAGPHSAQPRTRRGPHDARLAHASPPNFARCASRCANCAAACTAFASSSPASRSASWRSPASARSRAASPTGSRAKAASSSAAIWRSR